MADNNKTITPTSYSGKVKSNVTVISIPYQVKTTISGGCDSSCTVSNEVATVALPEFDPYNQDQCTTSETPVYSSIAGTVDTIVDGQSISYTIEKELPKCKCEVISARTTNRAVESMEVYPYIVPATATTAFYRIKYKDTKKDNCGNVFYTYETLDFPVNLGSKPSSGMCEEETIPITIPGSHVEYNVIRMKDESCQDCTPGETNVLLSIKYEPQVVPFAGGNVTATYTYLHKTIDDQCNRTSQRISSSVTWTISARSEDAEDKCSVKTHTKVIVDQTTGIRVPLSITQEKTSNIDDCNKICTNYVRYETATAPSKVEYWCKHERYYSSITDSHSNYALLNSWYDWEENDTAHPFVCKAKDIDYDNSQYTLYYPIVDYYGGRIRLSFDYTSHTRSSNCKVVSGIGTASVVIPVDGVSCIGPTEGSVSGNCNEKLTKAVSGSVNQESTFQIQYKECWTGGEDDPTPAEESCTSNIVTYDYLQEYSCGCPYTVIDINQSELTCIGGNVTLKLT